eukprot:scaffold43680_cov67-Phaeocystis_antarctica.AAC.1
MRSNLGARTVVTAGASDAATCRAGAKRRPGEVFLSYHESNVGQLEAHRVRLQLDATHGDQCELGVLGAKILARRALRRRRWLDHGRPVEQRSTCALARRLHFMRGNARALGSLVRLALCHQGGPVRFDGGDDGEKSAHSYSFRLTLSSAVLYYTRSLAALSGGTNGGAEWLATA